MAEQLERDDWETVLIPAFTGGLRTDIRPDAIDDGASPDLQNLWFDREYVQVDTGYGTFNGVVRGIPRLVTQFFLRDGSEYLCLITNDTFYIDQASEWQYVSDGTDDTLGADGSGTDTVLTTAGSATFTAADYIGITLDDGTQHRTTVASHVGTTLTIDDALPGTGVVATSGNAIVKAADLNGTAANSVSFVVMPAVDWFIFTNGIDNVKRFDGSTVEDVPNLPSSGSTACKVVALYTNHLLLMHTTEGGTTYPQRVRRCDAGDPTEWATGTAGYSDLLESEDFIVAAAPLGPYMIIYKERTIIRQAYVGSDDVLFNFDYMIFGEGALSQDSVVDLGDFHMFLGNSNVYEYRGSFDMVPIGDPIYYKIFGSQGEVNPSYKYTSFMIYVEELDEVWIFYPRGDSTVPNAVLRNKQSTQAWSPREFANTFVGFGFYQKTNALTWQEAPGTWGDYNYPWISNQTLSNSPSTLLCGNESNQVYEYDYIQVQDNGTDISFYAETKDFSKPNFVLRVDWIEFHIKGPETLIEYSTDMGINWTTYGTIPVSTELRAIRLYGDDGQFVADRFRFRLSGTGGGFQMGWIRLKYKSESQW